jgi:hypothetical protein
MPEIPGSNSPSLNNSNPINPAPTNPNLANSSANEIWQIPPYDSHPMVTIEQMRAAHPEPQIPLAHPVKKTKRIPLEVLLFLVFGTIALLAYMFQDTWIPYVNSFLSSSPVGK